jgi:hypothetical protein
MVSFHRSYRLGDKHDMSAEEVRQLVKRRDVIYRPLFLLDHSGLWLRTGTFHEDPGGWDTSCVGIIYVTLAEIRREYSLTRVSQKRRAQVVRLLESEVGEYSSYLSGDVYGYVIEDEGGNHLESCWGFIGREYAEKEILSECKASIDAMAEAAAVAPGI